MNNKIVKIFDGEIKFFKQVKYHIYHTHHILGVRMDELPYHTHHILGVGMDELPYHTHHILGVGMDELPYHRPQKSRV